MNEGEEVASEGPLAEVEAEIEAQLGVAENAATAAVDATITALDNASGAREDAEAAAVAASQAITAAGILADDMRRAEADKIDGHNARLDAMEQEIAKCSTTISDLLSRLATAENTLPPPMPSPPPASETVELPNEGEAVLLNPEETMEAPPPLSSTSTLPVLRRGRLALRRV